MCSPVARHGASRASFRLVQSNAPLSFLQRADVLHALLDAIIRTPTPSRPALDGAIRAMCIKLLAHGSCVQCRAAGEAGEAAAEESAVQLVIATLTEVRRPARPADALRSARASPRGTPPLAAAHARESSQSLRQSRYGRRPVPLSAFRARRRGCGMSSNVPLGRFTACSAKR